MPVKVVGIKFIEQGLGTDHEEFSEFDKFVCWIFERNRLRSCC